MKILFSPCLQSHLMMTRITKSRKSVMSKTKPNPTQPILDWQILDSTQPMGGLNSLPTLPWLCQTPPKKQTDKRHKDKRHVFLSVFILNGVLHAPRCVARGSPVEYQTVQRRYKGSVRSGLLFPVVSWRGRSLNAAATAVRSEHTGVQAPGTQILGARLKKRRTGELQIFKKSLFTHTMHQTKLKWPNIWLI